MMYKAFRDSISLILSLNVVLIICKHTNTVANVSAHSYPVLSCFDNYEHRNRSGYSSEHLV